MKRFIIPIIAILASFGAIAYAAQPVFTSPQVGTSPANGFVLQTNGTNSTWVATSTLGFQSNLTLPLSIANGGTATSSAVTNGVYYYNGTNAEADSNLLFTGTQLKVTPTGAVATPSISTGGVGIYLNGAGILGLTNGTNGISWNGTAFYPNTASARDLGIASTNLWNHLFANFASTTDLDNAGYATIGGTLTLSALTGTQCLHEISGVVSGTGSDCGTGSGGVTGIAATYPLITSASTGSVTISTAFGTTTNNTYSGTNTFANGLTTNTLSVGSLSGLLSGNAGAVYSTATSTLNASSPLTGSFTQVGSGGSLGCQTASGSQAGCLSSTDWTTFNGKQAAGSYITALTGDGTASGPGSAGFTLATVNGNVGTFTYPSITVNGKGLITAASSLTPVTSIAQTYGSAQTGAITFATTTDSFNGLQANENITNTGGAFTFSNLITGTLSTAGGGTGTSTGGVTNGVEFYNGTNLTNDSGLAYAGAGGQLTGLGAFSATSFNPTGSTAPVNGFYLAAANQLDFSTNSTGRLAISTSQINFSLALTAGGSAAEVSVSTPSGTVPVFIPNRSAGAGISSGLGSDAAGNLSFITSSLTKVEILGNGLVGVGTTTPFAKLSIGANNGDTLTTLFAIASSTASATTTLFAISNTGQITTSGTLPTVSGGTSSVSGNDNNGTVTVTGTLLTSVTLTFANPWISAPDCTMSDNSTGVTADITSISSTQLVFGFSAGVSSGIVWYQCRGHI